LFHGFLLVLISTYNNIMLAFNWYYLSDLLMKFFRSCYCNGFWIALKL
jgi:hypothetical protein